MKKIISLICLFTLMLTMAMPMQFIASADAGAINIGSEEITVDGITYVSDTDDAGNAKPVRGPFDFQDENGVPDLDAGTTIYNAVDDAEKIASSYATVDFSTLTIPGIEAGSDPDNHKGVFQHKGAGDWSAMYIFPNGTFTNTGGVSVINYDIFHTGALTANQQVTQINVVKESGGSDWRMKMMTREDSGTGKIKYTFQTEHNVTSSEVDIGIVEPGRWYNITLMIDIGNDTYTVLFDGVPKLVNCRFVEKISGINRMYGYRTSSSDVLWDNMSFYVYYPKYEVTGVKGVGSDDMLVDNAGYENGSKLAVQFNTAMKASSFAGNVSVLSANGKEVKINDIASTDYDNTTKTLYITFAENLEPDADYSIKLKASVTDDKGETITGVTSSDGLSSENDVSYAFHTVKTPYGVEDITYGSLTAGTTVNATVTLRPEEAVDANLVLVLYVDGALRSISSEIIDADALESSYTLPINVPGGSGEYKVCAMLLGDNYEVIDILNAD